MYYRIDGEPNKKFDNIVPARAEAVRNLKERPISVYLCNMVGGIEIGRVMKGPGYLIYADTQGNIYRLSKSGNVRKG